MRREGWGTDLEESVVEGFWDACHCCCGCAGDSEFLVEDCLMVLRCLMLLAAAVTAEFLGGRHLPR